MQQLAEISFFAISLAVFSYIASQRKSLSNGGILVAFFVGTGTFIFGGMVNYLVLLAFFAVAKSAIHH